jgi:glycosyltransferase involved in cell wall biosynthesis
MNRISIISICFNNLDDVRATCASVDVQVVPPYEHIIIDGSTKGDIKEFLENNPQPSYRKWLCERDKGISDAFNKGIKMAKGEVTNLLNSGDTLYDSEVLQKVQAVFEKDASVKWCHGKLNMLRGGMWVAIGKPFDKDKLYRGMRGTMHPTMYVRREMYDKHGLFDVNLKLAMDYDFLCRIANEKSVFIEDTLATFDPTGVSSENYVKAMKESFAQYRKYYGSSVKQTLWGWRLTALYQLLQSKAGKLLYALKVKMGKENA